MIFLMTHPNVIDEHFVEANRAEWTFDDISNGTGSQNCRKVHNTMKRDEIQLIRIRPAEAVPGPHGRKAGKIDTR